MKSLLLLMGVLMLAVSARAEDAARDWAADIYFYNPEIRYERDPNQDWVTRQPVGFAIGGRYHDTKVFLEYSSFSSSSGNDTLSIARQQQDYVLWLQQKLLTIWSFGLYVSAGAGLYHETVTTTLYGTGENDDSGLQLMGGVGAGAEVLIANHFIIGAEGRLLAGKNFDPNPQGSMLVRLGVEF